MDSLKEVLVAFVDPIVFLASSLCCNEYWTRPGILAKQDKTTFGWVELLSWVW